MRKFDNSKSSGPEFPDDPVYMEYFNNEVKNSNLESIADSNHLFLSANKCIKGVDWKGSVQKYEMNILNNIRDTQKSIRNKTYKQKPFAEFKLNERGHMRDIKSHHISDRVVQRSLNDNILIPTITPYLIYDNGASQINKGLSFSRKRFEIDLREAYQEYGNSGLILFIDFSKYFDNIQHNIILNYLSQFLNKDEFEFVCELFKEFEVDVSYMTDEEFASCMQTIFNSLEYSEIDNSLKNGKKFMPKSVGIGSQLSQITGIYYPHELDNYCKIVRGIKHYGRYMDDVYIILNNKDELMDIYNNINIICRKLGIFINHKKSRIQHITNEWLMYLKIIYRITETGGLIRKVHSSSFRRERRRLNKFHNLYINKRMILIDIINCYKCWVGTYRKYDSGYEMLKLDNYFKQLFNLDDNYNIIPQ